MFNEQKKKESVLKMKQEKKTQAERKLREVQIPTKRVQNQGTVLFDISR